MRNKILAFFVLGIAAILPLPLLAGPITVNGPWYEFSFPGSVGASAAACSLCVPGPGAVAIDTPPWTFNGAADLTVVDAFNIGDSFNVFDNGILIGTTSAPVGAGTCGSDPVACLANPNVSRGVFHLGAGAHSITITVLTTVGAGAAYLVVTTPVAVPAPTLSTYAFLGLALFMTMIGSAYLIRRRDT